MFMSKTAYLPMLKKVKENDKVEDQMSQLYSKLVDSIKTFLLKDPSQAQKQV